MNDSPAGPAHTHDFFTPVDWRWRRAARIVEGTGAASRRDDAVTAALVRLLQSRSLPDKPTRARAERRWRALPAALQLRDGDGALRSEVEARILAAQDDEEIAARCPYPPEVVGLYHDCF